MKIERVARDLIPKPGFGTTKWLEIFEEFVSDPDDTPVRLIPLEGEYKSKAVMYSTARSAVKRFHYGIKVKMIRGEVYLFKK